MIDEKDSDLSISNYIKKNIVNVNKTKEKIILVDGEKEDENARKTTKNEKKIINFAFKMCKYVTKLCKPETIN